MFRTPDLLATRGGRLTAFFFLYVTEGIPVGFSGTAVVTEMRRQGMTPGQIGTFMFWLYFPWAWKWVIAPFVDVIASERFGPRRAWIVLAQAGMVLTLIAAMPLDYERRIAFLGLELGLFTLLIVTNNIFGATQDVAIDALACNVLEEHERGLANGLMFAGAYLGQALGGSGALFLAPHIGFRSTFLFVAASILGVTVFVALPLRERRNARLRRDRPPAPEASAPGSSRRIADFGAAMRQMGRELAAYPRTAARSFISSRGALLGVLFALLPCGAFALGLALQSNVAVELGMTDEEIGWLSLCSTVISAAGCVVGGVLSDRFGRRRMLALYLTATALPTLFLAAAMSHFGWIWPVDTQAADRAVASDALLVCFWTATLVFAIFHGLMYGTRTALFMDVCVPDVAATQFTAYMALLNLVTSYSALWQGKAIDHFGYPMTLVLDAVLGLLCLVILPFMTGEPLRARSAPPETVDE